MKAKVWKRCVVGAQTEQMLKLGHPWVVRDRYTDQWPTGVVGEGTTLHGSDGTLLAYALRDDDHRIVARVIGWPQDGEAPRINEHWFYTLFEAAYKLRKHIIEPELCDAYRLVNAEGDLIPGLTVDVYAEFLLVQLYSRIWEPYREPMLQALQRLMRPQGVYEKFRPRKTRTLEKKGDKEFSTLLFGQSAPDHLQVKENGLLFGINLKRGLHTGLFMDQRENRKNILPFCAGKRVLNLFSFTGAFSVAAAAAGAVQVTSVDASPLYQERAQHNFALNRLNPAKHEFIVSDCNKFLAQLAQSRREFDMVIMDPPSFSTVGKKRFTTSGGTSSLVTAALRVLKEEGFLVTSSNHQKVDLPEYLKELRRGALQAATSLRVIQTSGQGPDFPFQVTCPEGRYLKYVVAVKG